MNLISNKSFNFVQGSVVAPNVASDLETQGVPVHAYKKLILFRTVNVADPVVKIALDIALTEPVKLDPAIQTGYVHVDFDTYSEPRNIFIQSPAGAASVQFWGYY